MLGKVCPIAHHAISQFALVLVMMKRKAQHLSPLQLSLMIEQMRSVIRLNSTLSLLLSQMLLIS